MSSVTTAEHATIRAALDADTSFAALDDLGVVVRLLTRPPIPNPEPAPLVLKPLNLSELLTIIAPSLGVLSDTALDAVGRSADDNDRAAIIRWVTIAEVRGHVTAQQRTDITDKLAETEPDPNHPPTVPGGNEASTILGRTITAMAVADVAAARAL